MKFEEYLKLIHAEHYMGTDDDMSDHYENWLTYLSVDELIKYADELLETERRELTQRRTPYDLEQ